ncbi:hypothetical protein FRC17_005070, partial [Serendipita sp. 399]
MTNLYIQPYQEMQSDVDKQLELNRCLLLAKLNGVGSEMGSVNATWTIDLKIQYNKIVDQQWSRLRGSFFDPLVALPLDVWPSILAMVVGEHPYTSLFNLFLVSQVWTSKLISCPTLWTEIIIDPLEEDLLAKMAIFLQLSQQSSLRIHFLPRDVEAVPIEVFELLRPHKDRIIAVSYAHGLSLPNMILWALQKLGDLPNLEQIKMPAIRAAQQLPRVLQRMPGLRQVDGRITAGSSKSITEAWLTLPDSVSLQISFQSSGIPWGSIDAPLAFRHLRNLRLSGDHLLRLDFLNCLHSPLTSLSFGECYRNTFNILVELIARFPLVETLDVSILPQEEKLSRHVRPTGLPPISSVKSLKLVILGSSRDLEDDIEEELLGT